MTTPRRRSVQLELETLEERRMLSATSIAHHGGFVQHTGAVEAIFYGPGWNSSEQNLEASIQSGLHAVIDPSSSGPNSYLATLKDAGYGSFDLSLTDSTNTSAVAQTSPINTVTDQEIQNYLSYTLNHPAVAGQTSDRVDQDTSSRVYLVIVDANDAVQGYNGMLVSGYHRTFNALINGKQQDVNYAVLAVPGGAAQNQPLSPLLVHPQLDTVTANASAELIDALTDPSGHGWYANNTAGTEIGDSGVYAYVNNALVVRPFNKAEAWMLPAQAAAPGSVTFLLDNSDTLWERSLPSSGGGSATPLSVPIAHGVTRVSDQGIDLDGRAMVDYLTTAGQMYEFHDGAAKSVLIYSPTAAATSPLGTAQGPAVIDARAGQGVSYLLLSNHTVWEYNDLTGGVLLRSQVVTALDAGTTSQGVNMVDVIHTNQTAFEVPDSGRRHSLKVSNVVQVSAGRQGRSALVDAHGTAWLYEDRVGLRKIATGIATLAAGFDGHGNFVLDLVSAGTFTLSELDYATLADGKLKANPVVRIASHLPAGALTPVPTLAAGGVISKMRAGVLDMVFADGVFEGDIDGAQLLLGTNLQRAV